MELGYRELHLTGKELCKLLGPVHAVSRLPFWLHLGCRSCASCSAGSCTRPRRSGPTRRPSSARPLGPACLGLVLGHRPATYVGCRPSSTTSSTGPTSQTTSRTLAPRSGSGRDRPSADRDRAEIAPPTSSEIKLTPRSPEIRTRCWRLAPARPPSFASGGPFQPRRLLRAAGGAAALDGVHPARPRPLREAREAARRKAPRGVRRGEVQ